jgi:hypothetical protein
MVPLEEEKKDLLIHGELLKGNRLVADGAQPLRPLLLELQIRGSVKALNVRTAETTARATEPRVGQGAFETEIQRGGLDVGIVCFFRNWR